MSLGNHLTTDVYELTADFPTRARSASKLREMIRCRVAGMDAGNGLPGPQVAVRRYKSSLTDGVTSLGTRLDESRPTSRVVR